MRRYALYRVPILVYRVFTGLNGVVHGDRRLHRTVVMEGVRRGYPEKRKFVRRVPVFCPCGWMDGGEDADGWSEVQ